ncbi:MAG: hypothetical protein R3293_14730 [Candidatus Promineifilaceae bacterium]|nr:hypothetical protein [Candidatus Promineifilaceae bacterium]
MRSNVSDNTTGRKAAIIFFVILALSLIITNARAQNRDDLKELWIDLSVGAPLIDLFNQTARSSDIARVEHISQLDMLREITVGKKLVVFKSAEDAIRLLPHIHEELDIIGYNLEHGPANPVNEQEDPVNSIRRLRDAADEYGLEVALGPDRRFAVSDASAMAPYADYLILQIQKVQTEPATVYDFVLPIIQESRKANPEIEVSLQIRTEGDVNELLDMLAPLQGQLDGISILTSEETVDVSEELLGELRDTTVTAAPSPVEQDSLTGNELMPDSVKRTGASPQATKQAIDEDVAPLATVVAGVLEDADAPEAILSAQTSGETVSTAEANQRIGSTWLFIIIALIAGIALGAGFISYRADS